MAAGLAAAAVGTDAAGSVRIPACQCGMVGFKPTYGRVPTAELIPLGWSLDHVGPITRTVGDAELLLNAMSWPTSSSVPTTSADSGPPRVEGLRVGLPAHGYAFEGVDPGIADRVRSAVAALTSLGVMVEEVDVPGLELSTATVYTIIAAEASAYHSRWWPQRAEDYGADVRGKLEAAARLSADDYVQAQRVRAQIVEALAAALEEVDAIVTPTAPLTPQLVGQQEVDLWRATAPGDGRWRIHPVHRGIQPLGRTGDLRPLWTDHRWDARRAPDRLRARPGRVGAPAGGRLRAHRRLRSVNSSDAGGAESFGNSSDRRGSTEATDEYPPDVVSAFAACP